jgi:iron complex transport system substrate-binding protein
MFRFTRSAGGLLTSFAILLICGSPLVYAQTVPFTIQADAGLQPALTALYGALYDGAEPTFVDADGDLLATTDAAALAEAGDAMPAYFLPGAGLALLCDTPEVLAFTAFAVSPDGQEVLIDEGLLPGVVTLTDQGGNTVEVPQPVRRIISTYSMGTYYIYAVGARGQLVSAGYLGARDPAGQAAMERIDSRFPEIDNLVRQDEVNAEEVAALQPDLVLGSPRFEWIDTVAELGVPIFLYEGETPERIKQAMLLTGGLLGPNARARAEAWVAYYDAVFEAITVQTDTLDEEERPRVLFSGTEPQRIASGDMYQTAMIEAAGGVSVSAELRGYWNDVNLEQILLWGPDVIFVVPYGGASVEAITESEEWQTLAAVRDGRVYRVPKLVAPWDTPVPDSVLGIVWMAQTLYPEVVELDCTAETEYFYGTFYDYDISAHEVADLCGS